MEEVEELQEIIVAVKVKVNIISEEVMTQDEFLLQNSNPRPLDQKEP